MSPVRTSGTSVPEAPVISDEADDQPSSSPDRHWLVAGVATGVLALPFLVAAVTLRRPHWYPVLDLAMTELRLRDVGTGHTPLIGLPGRIGPNLDQQGSHPGPLSFYALAPLYRAFGSSAWAMLAATALLSVGAIAAALAVAARRGGTRLVVAVSALLSLLVAGYGLTVLTQPWNPYLPLLWWVVFLLAVWSVLCDDVAMLPVAVAAGSFCAQTHVPYLGLVGGLGVVVIGVTALAWWRAGREAAGEGDAVSDQRRRIARWGIAGVVLGAALWVPPLVDQATNDPGNLRAIYDHLASPAAGDEPVGFGRGVRLAVAHLDVSRLGAGVPQADGELLDASSDPDGSLLSGLVVLAVWALAAAVAVRHGPRALVRLHAVVAAALVLGLVAMARILGKEWYYLMLWAWVVLALLVLAVGWSLLVVARARLGDAGARRRLTDGATAVLGAVAVASSAALVVAAVDVDPPEPHLSETLGQVAPDTVAALQRGEGAATGSDGTYVVMWDDAYYFGSPGYGLVSELERAGLDAGTTATWHVPITDHRVVDPGEATAAVHLATGLYVEEWRDVPEAVEVAYVEPRDAEELAEFDELHAAVIDDLRANGLDDLVPRLDTNLFGLSIDERISDQAEEWTARMLVLGQPTAVFVTPSDAAL